MTLRRLAWRIGFPFAFVVLAGERRLLAALLPRYEGKPTLLARALRMNRATLRKKLRGIHDVPDDADPDTP
jgi:DNA-binding NtrC family response regulator